ncbi:tRNA dihydrouridine(20/20a) synthase DusA [Candidatus Puniceispirillum marinum]|uniref:tRNA-dihydrouridine(20/20a) synthase n=1 Tax=Puniceispirillum marinum (strain IMCC1322) TaxID=488538 RepID=D5BST5_PUNMI|nr:tRNA dihydrouridine(20/20a) synthase DusA [Candidatus Puniceispirillum marinum]ADE39332.1 tRNA-dihydrouridine synthase A [Candidatus Puniceispirillum marinum IMCC1322]
MTNHNRQHIDRRLSVAPMMDWTDRHCRFFLRLVAPDALLFTEMVTADAIIHGDCERLLGHDLAEHPLALQLGGSDPEKLAKASRIAMDYGFAEINLNVGCPSDRVQSGRFGACLMAEPALVAECCSAMASVTTAFDVPVSVKCRIGIDDMDSETGLDAFTHAVADAGVTLLYVHARKAWLKGLSPKENRDIPPLDYARVKRLVGAFPAIDIHINGGIVALDTARELAPDFAGMMLGRAAYKTPMILPQIAYELYGTKPPSRADIAASMADYADIKTAADVPLHAITRHMLGLYNGQRGAKLWRRSLGEDARSRSADGGQLIRETVTACEALATQLAA